MSLQGVHLGEVVQLPVSVPSEPGKPSVVGQGKVGLVPRKRYIPIRAGSMYPRGVLGPSVAAIGVPLGGALAIGEGVVAAYAPPLAVGGLSTGGAATPLPPPYTKPNSPLIYSGIRDPQEAQVALSTFADANDTREQFVQKAMASYWGTTLFSVAKPTINVATPTAILSFFVKSSNWVATGVKIVASSQNLLGLFQVQVDIDGNIQWGPTYMLEGFVPLNIFANTGQTINVSIIVPTGIEFVSSARVVLDGYRDVA